VSTDLDNVVFFSGATSNAYDPRLILEGALKVTFDRVVVVGIDVDGQLFLSCSDPSLAECNLLLDRAKLDLMAVVSS